MRKGVIIIWMISLMLFVCGASDDDTVYITKENYPMALTLEDLELFYQSILNDDAAVFLKLRQEGRAWLSKAGVEVYIVETDEPPGKIKIRQTNSSEEIWTLKEAVRRN